MTKAKTLGVALGAAILASASVPASFAQEGGGGGGVYGGGSRAPYMSAGLPPRKVGTNQDCPGLTWHINRAPASGSTIALSGPIWYDNGTGVSFATGTAQPDGSYLMDVKSVSGNGPTGTLSGVRHKDGSVDVVVAGSPCFAGTYHLKAGQTSAKI